MKKKKKPYFIEEPYGLPFELQPAGKFRTDKIIKLRHSKSKILRKVV